MKNVFAISGSVRANSTNHSLIKAVAGLMKDAFSVEVYESVGRLPHFDPGLIDGSVPGEVRLFCAKIAKADGVIICTPEYAHGVPGALKNAIDWTVASADFSHKPTVLITASTDGRFGHAALLETLRVIEAEGVDELNMVVSFVRTKVSAEGRITDEGVLGQVTALMGRFLETMNHVTK
jgi:NAD(P)H-dependent FMN reductase